MNRWIRTRINRIKWHTRVVIVGDRATRITFKWGRLCGVEQWAKIESDGCDVPSYVHLVWKAEA